MSRHIVSNHRSFYRIACTLITGHKIKEHRQLIYLENSSNKWLLQLESAFPDGVCFVPANTNADRADRITHLLGQEHKILVHELSNPMDAGLLAALAGTVKASGILLLVLPGELTDDNSQSNHSCSRFSQRFRTMLAQHELAHPNSVHRLSPGTSELQVTDVVTTLFRALQTSHYSAAIHEPVQALNEQNELLGRACEFLQANDQGCVTITGRRGRGKSTLLARIADWLHAQKIDFAVTAANSAALDSFHQHAIASHNTILDPNNITRDVASVLLVDEAGNLPISLLRELMTTHQRIVFCTTVEGYEGTGRAFDVRFTKDIKARGERWLALSPEHSWRWGANDPLEHFINEIVINVTPDPLTGSPTLTALNDKSHIAQQCCVCELTQPQLANDENLLRQVFTLLRETHYQTSVADLQHLLDGDDVRLWAMQSTTHNELIGVLLVSLEGNIDNALHADILSKRRRLPHHLLPQLLAQMANSADALNKPYARVIRICIAANARRLGLGSLLLKSMESQLMKSDNSAVHTVGASFATDPASLAFWQSNGYDEFHRGYRLNPRTGLQAVAMLKTCDATVDQVLGQARTIHQDNQYWWHRPTHASSIALPADTLTTDGTTNTPIHTHTEHNRMSQSAASTAINDDALLAKFACAQRSAHDTHAALARLAQRGLLVFPEGKGDSQRAKDKNLRKQVVNIMKAIKQ